MHTRVWLQLSLSSAPYSAGVCPVMLASGKLSSISWGLLSCPTSDDTNLIPCARVQMHSE